MARKSSAKPRIKKASPPLRAAEPASSSASVHSKPSTPRFIFIIRLLFIAIILWMAAKYIVKPRTPGQTASASSGANAPAAIPIQRMDVVFKFDGIKSKSGYSGWASDGSVNPNLNKSINGTNFQAGGTSYSRGIGTHAPSEIIFDLKGTVRKFSCLVAPDVSGGPSDCIIFTVLGDGKKLFESPVMRGGSQPLPVDLSVEGVKDLSLQVNYGCSDRGWGHADWLNIKFVK